jgi:hypothetical protein
LKSDQEVAIMSLNTAVKREMHTRVVFEESPVGESKSLGSINVQIQVVQGQLRTLRDAIECRYQQRLAGDSMLIPWMIQHAVGTLNRYRMGRERDGRTPYHRVKGRKFNQAVAEFGECIWHLKPKSKGKYKICIRWEEGIWLGIRDRTGETLVGTSNGIVKVRSFRRKGSEGEKWDRGRMEAMKEVPWEPVPGREGIEIQSRVTMPEVSKEILAGTEYHMGERTWRRPKIEKKGR